MRAVLDRDPRRGEGGRPVATLTYAQSLDGCISASVGTATQISNPRSRTLTHQLRAMHDAIMVGVTTVLVDDPRLTVRHVAGEHPRPIIVDSRLRTPLDSNLLRRSGGSPIIATTEDASAHKARSLDAAGATVVRVPEDEDGLVDLPSLFASLAAIDIRSVMIEGGARLITSVLRGRLADQLVLTVSPRFLGGVHAVSGLTALDADARPRLTHAYYAAMGDDLVVHGEIV